MCWENPTRIMAGRLYKASIFLTDVSAAMTISLSLCMFVEQENLSPNSFYYNTLLGFAVFLKTQFFHQLSAQSWGNWTKKRIFNVVEHLRYAYEFLVSLINIHLAQSGKRLYILFFLLQCTATVVFHKYPLLCPFKYKGSCYFKSTKPK